MWKNLEVFCRFYFFCVILLFGSGCTNAQVYKYSNRNVPASYLNLKSALPTVKMNEFVPIEKYLPKGYSKRGDIDYTTIIQNALNENRNVLMPNFPVLVNSTGLKIQSNSKIFFQDRSKILLEPTKKDIYHIILIKNCTNVEIFNAQIVGDRKGHLGQTGEWGMGISIYSSENVKIYNPNVIECWGDGIYLGREIGAKNNTNISIYSAQLHRNRRNGISIISAVGLLLQSPVVSNTNGTLPMSGIVLEPNNNLDEINDVKINNARTFNNRYGILVYLKAMQGAKKKDVNIEINSPIDNYSICGVDVSDFAINKTSQKIGGKIQISNPSWENNQKTFSKHKNNKLPIVIVKSN